MYRVGGVFGLSEIRLVERDYHIFREIDKWRVLLLHNDSFCLYSDCIDNLGFQVGQKLQAVANVQF